MISNNSGKILTVFLIIIAILLFCLTGISLFFFSKEIDLRKSAEYNLEQIRGIEAKLQADLKEAKKQLFVADEKNKEAEEKIESLLEDLELEQGLREEIKKENRELRETMDSAKKEYEENKAKLEEELTTAKDQVITLQKEITAVKIQNKELEEDYKKLQSESQALNAPPAEAAPAEAAAAPPVAVDLGKIEVNQAEANEQNNGQEGKVISVDQETDFIIVNLGEKNGIVKGTVLSIYHADEYVGDAQVSRVLPEMSAADFVPPLTSQNVHKEDRVVIKQ